MNIYFFSYDVPDPQMIQDLGGSITAQFKGSISDIIVRNDQTSFTETLHIGGETCRVCHTIPSASIIITEAPLAVQAAWLEAGVATLLLPQVKQEIKNWGRRVSKYEGLIQVNKIEVVTSPWARRDLDETVNSSLQTLKPA